MNLMKYSLPFIPGTLAAAALLAVAVAPASACEPKADQGHRADPEVVKWLDKLEERGRDIESFQARATHETVNPLLGDHQMRIGHLDYLAADAEADRPARFAIRFTHRLINEALRERNEDWVFDGRWLVERQFDRRLFIKRQVVGPGERFDPLEIDGPFPVPIGQRRARVLARFEVELIEADGAAEELPHDLDEPPLRLRLTPRGDAPAEGRRAEFERIDLWFDRQTLLPLRVHTVDTSEKETTVVLTQVRVNELNAEAAEERFDTTAPEPGSGWDVEITRH